MAVHLLAVVALSVTAARNLHGEAIENSLFSLYVAQLVLLSCWAGLGNTRLSTRIVGTAAAIFWLVAGTWGVILLTSRGVSFRDVLGIVPMAFAMTCMVMVPVVVAIVAIRHLRFELWWVTGEVLQPPLGSQFSMRHLFAVITAAAILMAMSRFASATSATLWMIPIIYVFYVALLISLAISSCWAILGCGPVLRRLWVPFAVGLSFEGLLGLGSEPALLARQIVMLLIAVLLVVISLLVVRSCGYRLVPKGTSIEPVALQTLQGGTDFARS